MLSSGAVIAMAIAGGRAPLAQRAGGAAARTEADLVRDIETLAAELSAAGEFSGAVLLSRRGTVLFRSAYGMADRGRERTNTADTSFALGSVSKMFTAVLVAQLIEQSNVNTDATIGSLLGTFPDGQAKSEVTVQHLLTMSSGIPDVFRLPDFWTAIGQARALADFFPVFGTRPLEFVPGQRWAYSNSNFLILGAIVEQQLGESFLAAAETRVFRRAGMAYTTYQEPTSPRAARGYTRTRPADQPAAQPDAGGWFPAWSDDGGDGPLVHVPMGGGYSTVDDLARFADALTGHRLVGRDVTERMMTGYVPTAYGGRHGLGLETRVINNVRVAGHQGGAPGVSTQVDFYPDLGYVFVVLGNTDARGAQELAARSRAAIAER
jgi:CubicO group peptidase (beta-lactamase class C family)